MPEGGAIVSLLDIAEAHEGMSHPWSCAGASPAAASPVVIVCLLSEIKASICLQDPAMPGALSRKMMQKIVNIEYSYPPSIPLSAEVKDFIGKVFVKDPVTRLKVQQMLQHPW